MNNNNYTFKELVESIRKPKESEELEEAKKDDPNEIRKEFAQNVLKDIKDVTNKITKELKNKPFGNKSSDLGTLLTKLEKHSKTLLGSWNKSIK